MNLPITPRSVEQVLKIGDHRYFLASSAEVSQIEGVRRSWDVRRVPRQDGDPTQEFTLPLTDFSQGYGHTFSDKAGVYEVADGWDLSAPGKAITWDKFTSAAPVTSVNYRGWLYYNSTSGYMYMLRGSYATKYQPSDSAAEWPILERHYFGANVVVAGRPAEFQSKLYVPLVDIGTPGVETLARWHELDTFSTTITETQTLTESGTPTGGTFVLRFNDGLTTTDTSALAYNISAADMQTALRLIPGLAAVTVTRAGASNFVWTVVMTGAPSTLAATSPPQFTLQTNSLTGGSSPTITPATSIAGTGDRWDRADAGIEARTFTVWQKPTVGPVLVRANANKVSSCSTTPTTAANWGTQYEVGDTGAKITALATIGRLLIVGKEDGLWTGDESSQFQNELSDIQDIHSPHNCVGMRPFGGYLLVPHLIGLIRWRPGSSWRLVGAEQDGAFEGERSIGWGSTVGLAPYGRYCYQTMNDTYNDIGVLGSLQAPGSERGPLTPHMHQIFDTFAEDCAIVGIASLPPVARAPSVWSDDSAVGTRAWSNPQDAASTAASASATGVGTTHYLKGLNPAPSVPSGATIKGIRLELKRQAFVPTTTTTFNYTGAEQTYVVPAGVTSLLVDVIGAQGAGPSANISGLYGTGGYGGRVQTTITVTPGETLRIYVGGRPTGSLVTEGIGGYNGGGAGGVVLGAQGLGGGGASDIRQGGAGLGNRTVVAGGGGGYYGGGGGQEGSFDPIIAPSGAGGGGSSYVSAGSGTVHTQGYQPANGKVVITQTSLADIDDVTVKLVKAGAVVGNNLAKAGQWPTSSTLAQYGSATEMWGTTWTAAEVNAEDFGFVLSADVQAGEARVQAAKMYVAYTVAGVQDPGSFLAVITLDATRTIATPQIYKLPRAGMPVANDPFIDKAVSDKQFKTPRYANPHRNVQKGYRSHEFEVELEPEDNTPGLQIWASVDDEAFFPLLDGEGEPATITISGVYELNFPPTPSSIGQWVQMRPTVPALSGTQVPVAVTLRDQIVHGSWYPKMTEEITAVIVLRGAGIHQDGYNERRTPEQQFDDLDALNGPRTASEGPLALHDPVRNHDTYCVVSEVSWREIKFADKSAPSHVAFVKIRKTPYDAT